MAAMKKETEALYRTTLEEDDRFRAWTESHHGKFNRKEHLYGIRKSRELLEKWDVIVNEFAEIKRISGPWVEWMEYVKGRVKESVDREGFYNTMIQPGAPDKMEFVLHRTKNDDATFSAEGFQDIAYSLHDFMLARTMGTWAERKQPPRGMKATVILEFDEIPSDAQLQEGDSPWYSRPMAAEGERLVTPDGEVRLEAFFKEVKE